jgi:TonB family protein
MVGTIQGADPAARKVVYRQPPEYPTIAAQMNIHGTVRLKVWVTSDGSVRRVEYIGGHPLLAESAVKAVKNWKYEPHPTESTLQLDVKF